MFLDESSIWLSRLNEADCPPSVSRPLQICRGPEEQKGDEGWSLSLPDCWAGTLSSPALALPVSSLQTQTGIYTIGYLALRPLKYHWPSWVSSLQVVNFSVSITVRAKTYNKPLCYLDPIGSEEAWLIPYRTHPMILVKFTILWMLGLNSSSPVMSTQLHSILTHTWQMTNKMRMCECIFASGRNSRSHDPITEASSHPHALDWKWEKNDMGYRQPVLDQPYWIWRCWWDRGMLPRKGWQWEGPHTSTPLTHLRYFCSSWPSWPQPHVTKISS